MVNLIDKRNALNLSEQTESIKWLGLKLCLNPFKGVLDLFCRR